MKSFNLQYADKHGYLTAFNHIKHSLWLNAYANRNRIEKSRVNSVCQDVGYNPCSLEIQSRDTGGGEILSLNSQAIQTICKSKDESTMECIDKLHVSLYVKDKYSVFNQAYHELCMISDLPNLNQVRKVTESLNSQFHIYNSPNNIIGVQHRLRERILQHLTCFIHKKTEEGVDIFPVATIRIKLKRDGTKIGIALNVVNIAFTIIDEGRKLNLL